MKKAGLLIILFIGLAGFVGSSLTSQAADSRQVSISKKAKQQVSLKKKQLTSKEKQLPFVLSGFNQKKKTFVYVDNKKIAAKIFKNNIRHSVNLKKIKGAYKKEHPHRVYFVQYANDKESGRILTFKHSEYLIRSK